MDNLGEENLSVVKLEDRAKMRLEQLQKNEKDVEYTTQKKYIEELEALNIECAKSWNSHDRVKALKIVIKCTKTLAKNEVPQFYPSLFVLVSEVLETFGSLVYERIFSRSEIIDSFTGKVEHKLTPKFKSSDVTEDAKETCRNWFYKIASIRELVPRILVEMSLLPCQKFLNDDKKKIKEEVMRLAKAVRGIGDPLISMYARLYLTRKGFELLPGEKDFLILMFKDLIRMQEEWKDESFKEKLKGMGMTYESFVDLFSPCIEFLVECIAHEEREEMFNLLLEKYQHDFKNSILLYHIIRSFEPKIISNAGSLLVYLIKDYEDVNIPKHLCFKAIGEKFSDYPPNEKIRLLNEIWGYISGVSNLEDYLSIIEVYVEYVTKYFTMNQVTVLFSDIMNHIKNEKNLKVEGKIEESLKNILLILLENASDFVKVFNMEYFLQIFDMLKSSTRVQVSKGILNAFKDQILDPVVLNSLFDLAKTVHDSLNYLSDASEVNSVVDSLYNFIMKINFGKSFEKHLKFLTDCRSVFTNFDKPKEALVLKVLDVSNQTFQLMNGKHTKQTSIFVKSCFSFIHITIPSIDNIFTKLYLFNLSGQCALMHSLLGQSDDLFKAAIETVLTVPNVITENNTVYDTENDLVQFINTLSSCLISVPGHPEFGPFYLFKGLLNAIMNYQWSKGSDGKIRVLINILGAFSAISQKELPYSYSGVSGNDELYMEDESYEKEIYGMIDNSLDEIFKELEELSKMTDVSISKKKEADLRDLKNVLELHGESLDENLLKLLKI